jgi:sulfite exporter TauE/SafE
VILEALAPGFAIGIANAAHCAGMCGVFAAQASSACSGTRAACSTSLYLLGKTSTYAFLGALSGWLGAQILLVSIDAAAVLGVAAGALLLMSGTAVLVGGSRETAFGRFAARVVHPVVTLLRNTHSGGGPLALGAVSGLLPCGVVYLAAAQGAALGSPLAGALLMIAFGLGTVPALVAVGLLGRRLVTRLGPARLRTAGALLMLATGVVTLWRAVLPLFTTSGVPPCCH